MLRFGLLTEEEFRVFSERRSGLEKIGASFLQSVEMFRRYQKKKVESYLTGVFEGDSTKEVLVAAGLVVSTRKKLGRKIFKVPGGFLTDYKSEKVGDVLKFYTVNLKKFLKGKGGGVLEISPNIPSSGNERIVEVLEGLGYKNLGEYEQAKYVYVLKPGERTKEEIFKGFRSGHKYGIKRATRDGVRVRELGMEEIETLKNIELEAEERHGFTGPSEEYYREMKEAFSGKVRFLVSEITLEGENVPIAAAMFVEKNGEIVYLFSGSVRKYQKYNGVNMMMWHVIQEVIDKKLERYNFYGVKPVEGNGVFKYKEGFRGEVVELLGTFMTPIDLVGRAYVAKQRYRKYGEIH